MVPLHDATIRRRYESVLRERNVTGYITWKDVPREWVERNLAGFTTRAVGELMYQHVKAGGTIDQVRERREEYSEFEYHYDLRFEIEGRRIYVETILNDDDPDDPTIHVVSIHDA